MDIPVLDRQVVGNDPIYSLLREMRKYRQGDTSPVVIVTIRQGIANLGTVDAYQRKIDILELASGLDLDVYRLGVEDLVVLDLGKYWVW